MNKARSKPLKAFLSYAQHDQKLVDRLQTHLALLQRERVIDAWFDRVIPAEADQSQAIDEHLKNADIILLLISSDFLASDYCYGVEVKRALAMHDAGDAVVVPIIVRACDWHSAPFAKLQALPRDGKPIASYANIDEALVETTHEIRRIASTVEPSEGLPSEAVIELTINADFESYSEHQKKDLLEAIKHVLDLRQGLPVVKIRKGSVILRLKLPRAQVERLQQAIRGGELGDFNVVEAEVVVEDNIEDENRSAKDWRRPKVFIGSSTEGLEIAEAIQISLDHLCEVTIWNQGYFALGRGTLESLMQKLNDFDYAVLVMTPDDFVETRGDSFLSPRDNVVFELGLFMGFLGRDRTIFFYDRTSELKIPTDLAGVTMATYQPHSSGNLESALGAPCARLKKHIRTHGVRTT